MAHMRWVILFFLLSLHGCTYVDDYWLGKDNTPKPGVLAPLASKVAWTPCWTVSFGKTNTKQTYIRLKPAFDGHMIYAATNQGMVKAVNRERGTVLWSKQLPEHVVSGPGVGLGRLVFAMENARIVVLNQTDGRELWHADVSGQVLSTPLITDERVIVKTVDGQVYAFDYKTGAKLWVVDHGSAALVLKASSSPIRYDNFVLAGFSDGKLDAIDLATGRVAWQRSLAYANGASDVDRLVDISADPLVRGDTAYLASYQGSLVAMSLRQGEILWSKLTSTYRNLAMAGDTLYMTDLEDTLFALDRIKGLVQWKQTALRARGVTEPVLMGRRLLVGDKMGVLHLMDAKHGDFIARHSLGSPIIVGPLVHSDHIYVMTASGQLHCFSVKE